MAEAVSSLFVLARALTSAAIVGRRIFHKPSSQQQQLSPHCFLDIWDAPTSNNSIGEAPSLIARVRSENGLKTALESLPYQEPDKIRIFISELDGNGMTAYLFTHLQPTGPLHPQLPRGSENSVSGVRAVSSQWRGTPRWYRLDGWDYLSHEDMYGPGSRNQRRLRRQMSALKNDVKELVGQPDQRWTLMVKHVRVDDKDGLLRVFISSETKVYRRTIQPCISTQRFADELLELDHVYQPLRTKTNLKQLFLLQYHHANLTLFAEFLRHISSEYATRRKKDIDPRQSKLRQWNLRAIMNDVDLYRQFSIVGTELQTTIGLLSDVVLAMNEGSGSSNHEKKADLAILRAELSSGCKDVKARLDKLLSDLEQDLKFLSLSRDITQSSDVQTLTLLATIFLPLSLSAGMLSMQFRFHELGDRLYDFLGIVVLLVTIVVVLLIGISLINLGLEVEGRLRKYKKYRLYVRPSAIATLALVFITVGLLVLASFIVGMFKDVGLGGKILGWGVLAAAGTPVACAIVVTVCVFLVDGLRWLRDCFRSSFRSLGRASNDTGQKQGQQQRDAEEHGRQELVVMTGDSTRDIEEQETTVPQ